MKILGLIPACGKSVRMGRPKLSLPVGDRCVLDHVVSALRTGGVAEVLVVLAPHVAELQPIAERAGASTLCLPQATEDMRATIEAGLTHLQARFQPKDDDYWLLSPADHPTFNPDIIRQLLVTTQQLPAGSIVRPTYAGRRGHPVLIGWSYAAELQQIPPGQGVNALLRRYPERSVDLAVNSPSVVMDLDTPEDYARVLSERE